MNAQKANTTAVLMPLALTQKEDLIVIVKQVIVAMASIVPVCHTFLLFVYLLYNIIYA